MVVILHAIGYHALSLKRIFSCSSMKIPAGRFTIEVEQNPQKGGAWQVIVYKPGFVFKKRVNTDWFLDEDQAKKFATQLAADLESGDALEKLRVRSPGWTLHKAAR